MKKNRSKLMLLIIFVLVLIACSVGDFVDIPDTSGCIRQCNKDNNECLNVEQKCPLGDACFNNLEQCFNDANSCNHKCTDCEESYTCVNEASCRNACGDLATGCTNGIRTCFELKEKCLRIEVKHKEACLSGEDGFVECVAICIESIEQELE